MYAMVGFAAAGVPFDGTVSIAGVVVGDVTSIFSS